MITDVKACAKRLEELRATIATAETAQTRLDAERDGHARTVAAVDAREKALRDREAKLVLGERNLKAGLEALAADRRALAQMPAFDANFGPGSMGPGGITRDEYRS